MVDCAAPGWKRNEARVAVCVTSQWGREGRGTLAKMKRGPMLDTCHRGQCDRHQMQRGESGGGHAYAWCRGAGGRDSHDLGGVRCPQHSLVDAEHEHQRVYHAPDRKCPASRDNRVFELCRHFSDLTADDAIAGHAAADHAVRPVSASKPVQARGAANTQDKKSACCVASR